MGADLDNRSLPGVYVAVVMGRNAGFLTAASSAARAVEGDGPHLIYLPERTFDQAKFLAEVKSVHDRLGRCVIAVSEGIHDADGTPLAIKLAQTAEKDAHGNIQLSGTGALADLLCDEIKSKLGIQRVRGDTFGYLQRSFAGCSSDVDRREVREVGEFAVKQAIWGPGDGSVAIRRVGNYAVDYALVRLDKVARDTKVMPAAFIAGQRRYSSLQRVSAAAAGPRHAPASPPTRRFHRQGAEAVGFTTVPGRPVDRPDTLRHQRSPMADARDGELYGGEAGPAPEHSDQAPGNGAPIGGVKVSAASGWFAARPSGTEDIYKIYAESFCGADHLQRILAEAQSIVDTAPAERA